MPRLFVSQIERLLFNDAASEALFSSDFNTQRFTITGATDSTSTTFEGFTPPVGGGIARYLTMSGAEIYQLSSIDLVAGTATLDTFPATPSTVGPSSEQVEKTFEGLADATGHSVAYARYYAL